VQGGKADGPQVGALGPGVGDDHHVAGLALLVGGGGVVFAQVFDVPAQALAGQQALHEGPVALAVLDAQERVRRASGSARSQRHWAGVVGEDVVQDLLDRLVLEDEAVAAQLRAASQGAITRR
jgi:hypothetical protein